MKVLSVSPLLNDLASFSYMFSLPEPLCLPPLTDGSLGEEVTVAWKGPLDGACGSVVGLSSASGMVFTEEELVQSGSLEHLSGTTTESTALAVYL